MNNQHDYALTIDVLGDFLANLRDQHLAADNDDAIGIVESYLSGSVAVEPETWGTTVLNNTSANAHPKSWKSEQPLTLRSLAEDLRHPLSRKEKDGSCNAPITLVGTERKKTAVKTVHTLVYDVDGSKWEDIDAALSRTEVLSYAHTTHSHKSTSTEVTTQSVKDWTEANGESFPPSQDGLRAYLAANGKGYLEDVWYDPDPEKREQRTNGVYFVVHHAPVDKCRVILPLATPINMLALGMTTKEMLAEFGAIYHGVAAKLGLKHDRVCCDPSRLFYDPSHKPGAEYRYRIYGDLESPLLLDWRDEGRWTRERASETPKGKVKGSKAGTSKTTSKQSPTVAIDKDGVRVDVRRVPDAFDLESVLRDKLPAEIIGSERDRGGFHVHCPHHARHGDTDRLGGCFVANAGDDHPSWTIHCTHDHCKDTTGRERLAEFVRAGYVTAADLELDGVRGGSNKPAMKNWQTVATHADNVREALAHVIASNAPDPRLFEMAGDVVRLRSDERLGETAIDRLNQSGLRAEISECVDFQVTVNGIDKCVACPKDIAEHAYVLPHKGFPTLTGIATAPFFDRDGGLVVEPGYHEASGYYYAPPPGFVVPPVPDAPTDDDVARAVENINDVLADFPFFDGDDDDTGKASLATVFAKLVQPFVREMIDGPCPLYVTQKPLARTGASLLTDVCSLICYGVETNAMTEKADDAEYDKVLATMIREGARHVVFDNLSRKLDAAPLAQFITSSVYRRTPPARTALRAWRR